MKTAAVINESERQVVEMPPDCRIDADEVFVKQVGSTFMLIPTNVSPWQPLIDSLDLFSADFMEEREQPAEQKRKDAFE